MVDVSEVERVVSKNTNGIESSTLEALSKSLETTRRRADSA